MTGWPEMIMMKSNKMLKEKKKQTHEEKKRVREETISHHCRTLAKIITEIRPIYKKAKAEQQALIETMIGATIWYIPKPQDAWTGRISREALKRLHPDSRASSCKLSEEHVYPRKIAAQQLLRKTRLTQKEMVKLYRERYSKLHYITPDENKAVTRYQRADVFTTPKAAYKAANIVLIKVRLADLGQIKRRSRQVINRYLKKGG